MYGTRTEKIRKCPINFLWSSNEMCEPHHPMGIFVFFRRIERGKEKDDVPLTLPHFYCRKSGSANALVTRRFPVTCCPRSTSPRVSPPRLRERAEPVPARSGRRLFLAGVPVAPSLDTLESALLENSHSKLSENFHGFKIRFRMSS